MKEEDRLKWESLIKNAHKDEESFWPNWWEFPLICIAVITFILTIRKFVILIMELF